MEDNELKELVEKLSKRVAELEERLSNLEANVKADEKMLDQLAYNAGIA